MGLGGDLGGVVGGIFGLGSDDGSGAAYDYYKKLADQYASLNPNITASITNPDQPTRQAQLDALSNLKNIYSQGGLDAIGRSRIAEANTAANRNAQALAAGIGERARATGNTNSGVTLALQQAAGQDQAERSAQAARDAVAQGEATRMNALDTSGRLATAAGTQQNAIDRYNAMANQSAQEQTYANRMNQLAGQGNAYGAAYSAKNQGYKNTVGQWNQIWGGLGNAVDSAAPNYLEEFLKGGSGKNRGGGGGSDEGGDSAGNDFSGAAIGGLAAAFA